MEKYAAILNNVRAKNPLVHQITNYVTVNDCANITICAGASPVMSHAVSDVADMVKIADALVLNIGTLDEKQIEGMLAAGSAAVKKNIPIVLDPVGVGATPYRTETAQRLIRELKISVIKGNAGEIGSLAGAAADVRGVDSLSLSGDTKEVAKRLALATGAVVVVSGAEDIISDGKRIVGITNGHLLMSKVSGTGCMASAICAAFAASALDITDGCLSAMAAIGIAGEIAAGISSVLGPASFKPLMFDALYTLTSRQFIETARIFEY